MASVCDDCMKKSICKPQKEYNFACQWKNVKGKQRIAARDEWGLTKLDNKFVAENEEEGWVAIQWSIVDVDAYIMAANYHFEPELTNGEKMELLKTMARKPRATKETSYRTIDYWLHEMYEDRMVSAAQLIQKTA